MSRPALEVADVLHRHGNAYRAANAGRLSRGQLKVMGAVEACRTAALGGHIERCGDCGYSQIAYNSCLMGKSSNGEWRRVDRILAAVAANPLTITKRP
jgi:Transposase zinc-binding domain